MLGWIYFILSCYIVTFMAKTVYKLINSVLNKLVKLLNALRQPVPTPKEKTVLNTGGDG